MSPRAKKILFYTILPITVVLTFAIGIIEALCEIACESLSQYEDWTFGYTERGWVRTESGLYTRHDGVDQELERMKQLREDRG